MKKIICIICCLLLFYAPTSLGVGTWENLNLKTAQLYEQGEYRKSVSNAEAALKLAKASFDGSDPRVATAYYNLGNSLLRMGNLSKAEVCFGESLLIKNQKMTIQDLELAQTLAGLAELNELRGSFAEAHSLNQQALAAVVKLTGPDSLKVAGVLGQEARLFLTEGKLVEVEQRAGQAVAMIETSGGTNHLDLLPVLSLLTITALKQQKYSEAEQLLSRSLTILKETKARNNVAWGEIYFDQAELLNSQGDRKAESYYKRALKKWKKLFGPEHFLMAKGQTALAGFYIKAGKYRAAEKFLRQAQFIRRRTFGPESVQVEENLAQLAEVLFWEGNYLESRFADQELIGLRKKNGDYSSQRLAVYVINCGEVLERERSWVEARAYATQGLTLLESQPQLAKGEIARALNLLARSAMGLGDYLSAETYLNQAVATAKQTGETEPTIMGYLILTEALLRTAQGRYFEADPFYQNALQTTEKSFGANHPQVAYVLTCMRDFYQKYHRNEEFKMITQRLKKVKAARK